MKKKVLLLLTVILLSFANSKGQSDTFDCAFDSILLEQMEVNPKFKSTLKAIKYGAANYRQRNIQFYPKPQPESCDICLFGTESDTGCFKSRYMLPVVVHVIHQQKDSIVGMGSNIPISQIKDAIATLNKSFSGFGITDTMAVNTGMQFYLAPVGPDSNGIIRYSNSLASHNRQQINQVFNILNTDYYNDNYISIVVVDSILPYTAKGYAFMPGYGTFPIVVTRKRFGHAGTCQGCELDFISTGKTVAHEMGHHFGLYHTFHGGCEGVDSTDCHKAGDECCDTPPVQSQNTGCSGGNSCPITPENDQIENFMDYTEENCSRWFTRNQAERMLYSLEYLRPELTDIDRLNAHNPKLCMFNAWFKSNDNMVCDSGTVNLRGIAYNETGVDYRWTIFDSDNNVLLDTMIADNHILSRYFNTQGRYDVRLQVIHQSDTAEERVKDMIWVLDCTAPMHSEQANWFFGEYAGLVFTQTGTRPSLEALLPLSGQSTINSNEGCISVSDSLGNLMYYGGGTEVKVNEGRLFNKNHNSINNPNNQLLQISGHAIQNSIGFPCPFNEGKEIVIHTNAITYGSLYYTLLEKDTSGIMQLVPNQWNRPLNVPGFLEFGGAIHSFEQITAAPKCDGKGYWLVVVSATNDYGYIASISVDTNGFELADTFQVYDINSDFKIGAAKFSPDATKLALMHYVFDFDRITGKMNLKLEIPEPVYHVFGLSFSPNSRYFYWNEDDSTFTGHLVRIDLSLNDPLADKITIGNAPGESFFQSMQLGPDNQLYIANFGSDSIGVIMYPDKEWNDIENNPLGYYPKRAGLRIGNNSGTCRWGLPNMIDARKYDPSQDTIYYTVSNCNTVSFSSTACCSENYLWLFGDGDTSQQKEAEHTYSNFGSYIVKLVLNHSDTIYVDLNLNNEGVALTGPDSICNASTSYVYQANGNFSSYANYIWEIDSGSLFTDPVLKYLSYADFTGFPAKIKVHVYDPKSECESSDSMIVVYHYDLDNNIINSGTNSIIFCNNHVGQFSMTGSTPTGGDGSYNYLWLISYDSLNWQYLDEQTSKNLASMTVDTIAFIQRFVESNGCNHLSNIVKVSPRITNNKLHFNHGPCINSSSTNFARIIGDSVKTIPGAFEYKWQVSSDNNIWVNHLDYLGAHQVGKPTRYEPNLFDTIYIDIEMLYFRRVIRADGTCENRSNVIKVVNFYHENMNKIKFYSEDSSIIHGVEEVEPDNRYAVVWQKSCNEEDWEDITESYSKDSLWNAGEHGSFYIRRTIKSILPNGQPDNCFEKISNVLTPNESPFNITNHPVSTIASFVGDSAFFNVEHNGSTGTLIQWQVSNDEGETWTDISGGNGLSLKVIGDYCNNDFMYRAKVYSGCQSEYSDSATLTVDKGMIGEDYDYKVWLKTNPNHQNAAEPYLTKLWTISPDIFVNQTELTTRPSITRNIVNIDSNSTSVYVHTYIRNKGTVASAPAELFLYYTRNIGVPRWELDFSTTPQTVFRSYSGGTMIDINYFFTPNGNTETYGGAINDTAIYVPSINPGDSILIAYYWTNVPPPYQQYFVADMQGVVYKRHSMLFYARIETCDNKDRGMNTQEIVFPNQPTRATARFNTTRNARIAALASYLLHPEPPQSYNGNPDHVSAISSMGGAIGGPVQGIKMDATNHALFFNKCELIIQMDDNLWDAWTSKSQGSGFTVMSPGVFKVDQPVMVSFDSLMMPEDSIGHIGFYVQYKPAAVITGNTTQYYFDVEFLIDDTVSGMIQLHVDADSDIEGPPSAFMDDQNSTGNQVLEPETTPLVFSARPNPFSNELKVFVANFEQGSSVTMFDMNGKQLFSQSLNNKNSEQVLTFQTAHLAEGVYYVHYRSQNRNMVRKIVLVR